MTAKDSGCCRCGLLGYLRSSIGKKFLMGASGLALLGFVIAHLLGNLTIFLGPGAINAYAEKLRHLGPGLWVARAGLLAAAALHLVTGIQLAHENRAARPQGYRKTDHQRTTLAALTMAVSGALLLAYIIYHLLQFTFRVTDPGYAHLTDALGRHDVYTMVVSAFRSAPVAVIYVAAMGLLCAHLSHGVGSLFQSVGLNDERFINTLNKGSRALAALLFIGYSAIPIAVQAGWLKLAAGGAP